MKIDWFSCGDRQASSVGLFRIAADCPQLVVDQGDTPYVEDSASNFRGVTTTRAIYTSTVDDMFAHYVQVMNDPAFQAVQALRSRGLLYYKMRDDHEWGGDDWDNSPIQANDPTGPIGGAAAGGAGPPTQAEVDAHSYVSTQAFLRAAAIYYDNPTNVDAPSVDKPDGAAAGTAASQYPVTYFRQGFDYDGGKLPAGQSGNIEVFVIDCVSSRSFLANTDNSSKYMLGPNQEAWLLARLLASTATWKLIFTGKVTFKPSGGGNSDTWNEYQTQRTRILDYIKNNNIKGVVWLTGDKHLPHVVSLAVANSDAYDHVCICACPISVPTNGLMTGTMNGVVWQGADDRYSRCYGRLLITSTQLKIEIVRVTDGSVMWRGSMIPTSNALVSNPAKVVS